MGRLMGGVLRRATVLLAVSAVWLALATPAAALLGWSQSPSSSTGQVGQSKAYTLRVSNDNLLSLLSIDDIGCVRVDVGTGFAIQSVSIVSGPGGDWFGSISGSVATVQSDSGGSRLGVGESVTFTVTAVPLTAGSLSWTTRVIRDQGCGGSAIPGTASLTIQVTPASTPSPTPTPAPTPTPRPTPTPTPAPLVPVPSIPIPTIPIPTAPVPSIGVVSTPRPSPSTGTPAPPTGAPATPAPSASTGASPAAGGPRSIAPSSSPGAAASSSAGGGGTASTTVDRPAGSGPASAASARSLHAVAAVADVATFGLGQIGLVGDVTVWVVPAAVLGVPGALVIAWVILQAVGVLAWVPAMRRLRGESRGVTTG